MPRIFHAPEFQFQDSDNLLGTADLQIFRRSDQKIIVIVSELIDSGGVESNRGVSVTDGIEQIATTIFDHFGFQFDYLIEHYPQHGPILNLARSSVQKREQQEQFHLVTLRWDESRNAYQVDHAGHEWAWKQINRSFVEELIEEPFSVRPTSRGFEE